MRVLAHQIARAIPRIASGEDMAQNFLLRCFGVRIAFESTAVLAAGVGNLADGFACLIDLAADAQIRLVTQRGTAYRIELHELDVHAMRQEGWDPPDRTRPPLAVVE